MVAKRVAKSAILKAVAIQAREAVLDDCEAVVFDRATLEKDPHYALRLLATIGRSRGYGEEVVVRGDEETPVVIKLDIRGALTAADAAPPEAEE